MSKEAIEHYEAALKEAFPSGASGDVFHHWNEARKALAEQPAQQEQESWEDLHNALQRIDTAAVGLPTFEVRHEGGLDAVTQNIVDAITALHTQPAQQEQNRQIDQLIQERDHRDEIIDKLCDAVLGSDRYEWSSQYFFEDAVREVEERMAEQPAQQEPVGCAGAIVNGRVYADRLEHDYKFECEAGPLHLCNDWVEFRRCFEWLAQHTSPPAQRTWVGLTDEHVDKAAMKLAECMDYPWAQMPEQGKQSMRSHAKAVIEASGITKGQK